MSSSSTPSPASRRAAAIGAFAFLALALATFVVGMGENLWEFLVIAVGLGLVVTGGWYFVAHRGSVRWMAAVVSASGIVVLLAGLVMTGGDLLRLGLGVALMAASVGCAQYATRRRRMDGVAADLGPSLGPARQPVLIMNPRSGGGKVEQFNLIEECRQRGIEAVVLKPGDDMVQLAEDAVARGADVLGMAGGDGSQALVATVAMKHGVPHVVIPAGTRNHLALDLGLDRDDVVGALDAFHSGIPRRVDLATVNGRIFVNNASMGLYAHIVQSDAYRDAKLRTALDKLPDLLGPDSDSLDLHFVDASGTAHDGAEVILVSNNPYSLSSLAGTGTRARMDQGVLGVVSLTLRSAAQARRFMALEAVGQPSRFSGWREWTTQRFEITSSGPIEVGVDGEALTMPSPVVFETVPDALTILLPPQAPGRSPAARKGSRDTTRELWNLALGRE